MNMHEIVKAAERAAKDAEKTPRLEIANLPDWKFNDGGFAQSAPCFTITDYDLQGKMYA